MIGCFRCYEQIYIYIYVCIMDLMIFSTPYLVWILQDMYGVLVVFSNQESGQIIIYRTWFLVKIINIMHIQSYLLIFGKAR